MGGPFRFDGGLIRGIILTVAYARKENASFSRVYPPLLQILGKNVTTKYEKRWF